MVEERGYQEIEAMVGEHTQVRLDSQDHRDFRTYLVSVVAAFAGSEQVIAYADSYAGGNSSRLEGVDALFVTATRLIRIYVTHKSVEGAVAPIGALSGVAVSTRVSQDTPTFRSSGDVLLTVHLPDPLRREDDPPVALWRWRIAPGMTRGEWEWRSVLPWLMALGAQR
jgi:hypothetical protein